MSSHRPLGISDQLRAVIIKSTPGPLGISDQLRPVIWSFLGNMPSLWWPLGIIASIGPELILMRPLGISCQHGPFTQAHKYLMLALNDYYLK